MYFITNKEGLIIAASSEFISKVGSRDVCSLSSMLSDKLINFKEDNILAINNCGEFGYTKTDIYSAFGDLQLYRLLEKSKKALVEDDESIEYLKKIKEGSIVKEDNEYSVPDIAAIKDSKESAELPQERSNIIKEIEGIDVATPQNDTKIDEIANIKEIEDSNNQFKETIAKIDPSDPTAEIEKIESIKPKETDAPKESKQEIDVEAKEPLELKIPEIPEEAIKESYQTVKIDIKDDDEEVSFVPKEYTSTQTQESIEPAISEAKVTKEDIVDTTKDNIAQEKEKTQKKKKGLFSSGLFPWGKRKKEEETTQKVDSIIDTDISKDTLKIKEESTKESLEVTKEPLKESEIANDKIASLNEASNLEIKEAQDNNLNIQEQIETKLTEQKESIESLEIKDDSKIEIKDLEDIKTQIEESDDKLDEILSEATKEPLKESEILDAIKEESELDIKPAKEPVSKPLEPKESEVAKDELLDTKEQVEQKEELKSIEESLAQVKEPIEQESTKVESSSAFLAEKIALKQIESLNLAENAKKLNIDLSSYKMLLNSYLGEIDKYMPKLKENDTQSIDMLIDAGQLLSLDSIISKLTSLKNDTLDDKDNKLIEIEHFTKFLKEKLNNTKDEPKEQPSTPDIANETTTNLQDEITKEMQDVQEEQKPTIEPKMVKIEDTYGTSIDSEFKEESKLLSASELLETIAPEIVEADPSIAAQELNLPEKLMLEFMHDFLAQSKEHLPVFVDAFLDKDIQKVQGTAHMLKGAANNLRLNKIADNLFKIQKEDNLDKDVDLIKKFVAHIKGLEIALEKLGE
jgi:HPt (histidine-containing phosphotransfer) domain-containing protein